MRPSPPEPLLPSQTNGHDDSPRPALDQPSSGWQSHAADAHPRDMAPRHARLVSSDSMYWEHLDKDDMQQPLDALGICDANAQGPNRYAVQRGRLVPQRSLQCANVGDVVLPSQNEYGPRRHNIASPRRSSPRLDKQQVEARHPAARRPTSSSFYSSSEGESSPATPEYTLASFGAPGGSAALQISPPSSPDFHGAAEDFAAGDVSPIGDDFDHTHHTFSARSRVDTGKSPSRQRKGSIPRPTQSGNRAQNAAPQPRGRTRVPLDGRVWNQQVPAAQTMMHPKDEQRSRHVPGAGQWYGLKTTIYSAAKDGTKTSSSPSFGQRVRLMGKTKPAASDGPPQRNGASGRSAMVQPVRNDAHVAPLYVQAQGREGRRTDDAETSGAPAPRAETLVPSSTGASAVRRLLQGNSTNKPRHETAQAAPFDAEKHPAIPRRIRPSLPHEEILVPEAGSFNAPAMDLQSQALRSHPLGVFRPSLKVIKRKPHGPTNQGLASNHNTSDVGSPVGAQSPRGLADTHISSGLNCGGTRAPPSPRCHITTCALSDAGSPRLYGQGSVPRLPVVAPTVSVMDRSRPITSGRGKSSGSERPILIEMSSPHMPKEEAQDSLAVRRNLGIQSRSIGDLRGSTSKPLPQAPHQGKSGDLVSQLDAQISELFHRRVNVEKSIKQMTELMPRDNLLASDEVLRKREEEKQKVEKLKQVLAEIQREEYELGLKLFRARKRQNKEAAFESTPLWVSRVAG